ncbi:MAG: DEAD/DEAH box helicase [Desulforegulaceae bacterium]|nr:DEAD/DEAH box helicase [Desulforegulaceae bacterium]
MKLFLKSLKKNFYLFFKDPVGKLEIQPQLKKALYDLNFKGLTPIQKKSLPKGVQQRDIIGQAQTGTGKTVAYLTILFSRLLKSKPTHGQPRSLILAPTRELVVQIYNESVKIGIYTDLKSVCIYGGDDMNKQRQLLKENPEVIIATPGRLLGFMEERIINLSKVEVFVIDEADRMLDMGFMPDVRRIESKIPPKGKRQTLFFSATLPEKITRIALNWTVNPKEIRIDPENITSQNIEQKTYLATSEEKFPLLLNFVKKKKAKNTIVFTNQKYVAKEIYDKLRRYGVNCRLLTGDIPQNKRLKALEDFQKERSHILIATDVAARGLHIDNVSHVINYNMPNKAENYVHRIGRTGRAGKKGKSISFACQEDSFYIPAIEEFTETKFDCEYPPEEWLILPPAPPPLKKALKQTMEIKPKKTIKPFKKSRISDNTSRPRPVNKKTQPVNTRAGSPKPVVKKKMAKTVYKNGKMVRIEQ